jgi:hypothetical protein
VTTAFVADDGASSALKAAVARRIVICLRIKSLMKYRGLQIETLAVDER